MLIWRKKIIIYWIYQIEIRIKLIVIRLIIMNVFNAIVLKVIIYKIRIIKEMK